MSTTAPIQETLDDPVARHMRTDFARLRVSQTVGEALEATRERALDAAPPSGRVIYFYVVDDEGRLEGVVPTRRLLLSPLETPIADIMVRKVIALTEEATVLDACEFFTLHRLLAFPVVDNRRRMLGVVDIELYTNELADIESSTRADDLFQLVGVHLATARQASAVAGFRSRFPWLLANVAGGILSVLISGIFRAELEQVVMLALFIPLVLALAESVSIQSVSLAIQLLRGQQPTLPDIFGKIRGEALTGLLLGAASAALVGLAAMLWFGQFRVVLVVSGGILGGVTCAAAIGMTLPNILRYFQREPHVAAGPIVLAAADITTLLIYFRLARWLL
jgi:magnesium transporter